MDSPGMIIRPYHDADEKGIVELWQRCGLVRAVNNPYRDIRRKLNVNGELFLVGTIDGQIVATVMAGYDGHRGGINYVGVDPAYRRQGLGREIMAEAERRLAGIGCPKINLQVRGENKAVIDFYRQMGFIAEDNVQMGRRLEIDEGSPITPAGIEDDERFLEQFENQEWPLAQWHHRQHIKVAYLYLQKYSLEEACQRIAKGICSYNAANKIVDTPTSGYHETMTQAWVRLVDFAIKQYGMAKTADEFFDGHPELWQFKTLRLFYSRERFMSAEAKANFVEPDLTAFPRSQQ
jgi:GNAT superfamily N-acetyltransferase